ncbi:MAG: DUF3483 domain-containing protein [Hyphomonadaceae bacterium]|nr:DUF3483 domain-containing protein [Hyphomonadaceae bacterium]
MVGLILSVGILAILSGGLLVAALRVRLWAKGRPANIDWWTGIAALPRRYLVDVHDVVARTPLNARFHMFAAGGFLLSLPLLLLTGIPGFSSPWLWSLAALSFIAAILGALLDIYRRAVLRPGELSRGGFARFPFLILIYALAMLIIASVHVLGGRLPFEALAPLIAVGLGAAALLIFGLGRGPLRHAFAGAVHLVVHPRPARFAPAPAERRGIASGLEPLDLDQPKLGVETPSDFAWNRLVGFDACVQCGRCESVCPAHDAGLPLNPKALVQDLVRSLDAQSPDYFGTPHTGIASSRPGRPDQRVIGEGATLHPDTLWACTTCRACVEACPMMIEHVDAIVDLRRFQTLDKGATPGKGPELLEELQATDNTRGLAAVRRVDWASDLSLKVLDESNACDILLWLGDAAFEMRGQRTLRALVHLLDKAGLDIAILGEAEKDCGDQARRLGDEAGFQRLAHDNIELLENRRFGKIVTADPHALHVLRNEYPAFGGHYEVVHHTALLLELVEDGRLQLPDLEGEQVTYHDPCYLGRYNGEYAAPRKLLEIAGAQLVEMERSGPRSHCCGGGGGAPVTDISGEARIPDRRMQQAVATGAGCVAVACPGCTQMLEGTAQPRPTVLDIAELLSGAKP